MFQTIEQNKFPETDLKEMEFYEILDKGFNITTLKELNQFNNNQKRQLKKIRKMNEQNANINMKLK